MSLPISYQFLCSLPESFGICMQYQIFFIDFFWLHLLVSWNQTTWPRVDWRRVCCHWLLFPCTSRPLSQALTTCWGGCLFPSSFLYNPAVCSNQEGLWWARLCSSWCKSEVTLVQRKSPPAHSPPWLWSAHWRIDSVAPFLDFWSCGCHLLGSGGRSTWYIWEQGRVGMAN